MALSTSAVAQGFDNRWVEFVESPGSLPYDPLSLTSIDAECDFAFGDLDKNGWQDVVVVRKQPYTTPGKRRNALLMNTGGVLIDRTELATASDIPGDEGFLTLTNDKNVKVGYIDDDDWLDVVTAVVLGEGQLKHISHPRVYINQGESGGVWQGLKHEDARIPVMLTPTGLPAVPNFADLALGDVDGDGDTDLYFVDHDDGVGGYHENSATDAEDHLLINDGNGWFTDETLLRLTPVMIASPFSTDAQVVDLNLDGVLDLVKTSTNSPNEVVAIYNNPANEGVFNIFHDFWTSGAPYSMTVGDLNNDGRLDVIAGDDSADRFFYNQSNDALGRVVWSPALTFAFVSGSENEFVGNPYVVDLDMDGWNDVLVCDEDVDVPGGSTSRAHIYHNPGGAVGSFTTKPIEERQSSSSSAGQWVGAVGFDSINLRGSWDAAIFDLDNDTDPDIVLGQMTGTRVWLNQTVANTLLQDDPLLSLVAGGTQNLLARAGPAHAAELYWMLGSASGTTPGFGTPPLPLNFDGYFLFTLTNPNTLIQNQIGFLDGNGNGQASITLPPGMGPSLAGITLSHAYVAIETVGFTTSLVSNPVPLLLVP